MESFESKSNADHSNRQMNTSPNDAILDGINFLLKDYDEDDCNAWISSEGCSLSFLIAHIDRLGMRMRMRKRKRDWHRKNDMSVH